MKRVSLAALMVLSLAVLAPATQASARVTAWQIPGGNVECGYDHGSVVCMIFKQHFAKKPSCRGYYTAVGSVKRHGKADVDITCWSGIPIVSGPPFHTLRYGHSIKRLGVTCYSFKGGMKCVNKNDHGFKLKKSGAFRF